MGAPHPEGSARLGISEGGAECRPSFRNLRTLYSLTDDVPSLLTRATELERAGDWQTAASTLHVVYEASLRTSDIPLLLEAVVRLGHCHRLAGRRDLATDMLELARALGRIHARPDIEGRALNGMGVLMLDSGELKDAETLYRAANELGHQSGDDVLVGETEQNLGILADIRGDVDEARVRYETALLHLERAGSVRGRISSLNNLGLLHLYRGQFDAADEHFARALRICEEVGDVVRAGMVQLNRTELFLAPRRAGPRPGGVRRGLRDLQPAGARAAAGGGAQVLRDDLP